jgi:nucleoside-diphosphate-sugar epimerase
MKVFVTGATGFVTGNVTLQLLARGDEVRALVRDASRGQTLARAGVTLVEGDLSDGASLARGIDGVDAVVHGAAMYSVGIAASRRPAMFEANVTGTERVLEAALAAGVRRVAYVSTCAVFGNTRGAVVDETYTRSGPYTSYYEETKVRAHEIALGAAARGLAVSIAQPGGVYGPGDTSGLGGLMRDFVRGRLPLVPFADAGLNFVHVDDVARGDRARARSRPAGTELRARRRERARRRCVRGARARDRSGPAAPAFAVRAAPARRACATWSARGRDVDEGRHVLGQR